MGSSSLGWPLPSLPWDCVCARVACARVCTRASVRAGACVCVCTHAYQCVRVCKCPCGACIYLCACLLSVRVCVCVCTCVAACARGCDDRRASTLTRVGGGFSGPPPLKGSVSFGDTGGLAWEPPDAPQMQRALLPRARCGFVSISRVARLPWYCRWLLVAVGCLPPAAASLATPGSRARGQWLRVWA